MGTCEPRDSERKRNRKLKGKGKLKGKAKASATAKKRTLRRTGPGGRQPGAEAGAQERGSWLSR
jgi:hypothetical protein